MRLLVVLAFAVLVVGCAAGTTAPAPATAPPAPKPAEQPAQAAPKPAAEAKPAAESKPAGEAKPAAASKPAQPAKPAAASKPAQAAKPAASGAPTQVTISAPGAASSYYVYSVALSRLLQTKMPGLNVTVSEVGGTTLNAKRIAEGKGDFGTAGFSALYLVYTGLDPAFKDTPLKEARALWIFDPAAQTWFVREDSGIKAVDQLHGKDFAAGARGSATEALARILVFPTLGVQPKWYVGGQDDVLAAMKDRRIVGMGKATSLTRPDAQIQDALVTMKIRILSWTPEQVQKVKAQYPFLSTTDIPAGVYKAEWNEKPITTWQDGVGMFTVARLSNDLAYQFTKIATEDIKASGSSQVAALPGIAGNDLVKLTLAMSTVPLHAGTQKYFQEVGASIPDHLKSPEAR